VQQVGQGSARFVHCRQITIYSSDFALEQCDNALGRGNTLRAQMHDLADVDQPQSDRP
jgi:hypothetical protein